ncbi:hypothetical protein GOP97_15085 [Vibrio cholerae]|uniref:hypothetical protein n=1 Tax=Vibrio cholerae TaxID=666 RepID=UPI002DBCC87F|nr:hypothetical protein [Vibrio cholerae]MEB5557090.1 hypothetical protein [Vibrio cholerae]
MRDHIVFVDEAEHGITSATSDYPTFSRSMIGSAVVAGIGSRQDDVMKKSMLEAGRDTGKPQSRKVVAQYLLAKKILREGYNPDAYVAFNPVPEFRFSVDTLSKFQLDITEEHLRSEAAGFLAWLFDCLKGLGFNSVDGAREKGCKFLMLGIQAEVGLWPRIDTRMAVVLSPDGENIAQREISDAAITRLDAVFEEFGTAFTK